MPYAELEMGLHHWEAGSYAVELRFSRPDSDVDVRLIQQGPTLVRFDAGRLEALVIDTTAYGQMLSQSLFAHPSVQQGVAQARAVAQSLSVPLRLRLFIDASDGELHRLHWEKLSDPADPGVLLACDSNILFSRYLPSLDWRPVQPRTRDELRALVVVANPTNLHEWRPGGQPLAPVDVDGELERARTGLGGMTLQVLASSGSATLENLITHLRDGYDILYLVCHGALLRDEPRLWLEHDGGLVDLVSGSELVSRLKGVSQQPRLVVLASCQSAGTGEAGEAQGLGSLSALGPRLADAGVPAVVAMQGNISLQTVATFMPVFFRELQRDGQIDRAMAAARAGVSDRPDHWVPVLYTRLRSGRLWYEPGFAEERSDFTRWPALISNIAEGRSTPILGSGLLTSLIGSTREIGRRWAATYRYPLAPHTWEDLPQVAQYLSVDQDFTFPRSELRRYIRQELLHRFGAELPDELRGAAPEKLLSAVGARRRQADPLEPHRVLAGMPCPVYITTNPDNLLADALTEAGKKPRVELFPWTDEVDWPPSVFDDTPDYMPSPEEPLVYYLFGNLTHIDSLVLTEDDYFNYLIGAASNKSLVPAVVRRQLVDSALLFLGFQLDDWDFRVLFRSIASQEGRSKRRRYAHLGVQLDPQAGRILEPELARHYLQRYFEDADINIYWGNVDDFLKELQQRLI